MYKPGTRVVAMSHSEGDTLYIFGYGTYEGDFIPPFVNIEQELEELKAEYPMIRAENPELPEEPEMDKLRAIIEFTSKNPRIKLDNGKTVWGYECWWGDIEGFEGSIEQRTHKHIVEIDIDEAREKAKKASN